MSHEHYHENRNDDPALSGTPVVGEQPSYAQLREILSALVRRTEELQAEYAAVDRGEIKSASGSAVYLHKLAMRNAKAALAYFGKATL